MDLGAKPLRHELCWVSPPPPATSQVQMFSNLWKLMEFKFSDAQASIITATKQNTELT